MNTTEQWRSVPSEPLLEASSLGRVRSLPYETPMPSGGFKVNQVSPTYGTTAKMSKNYVRKILVFRRKTYRVHQLVAEAFIGFRPLGLITSHKDEDSLNNRVDNLEYITRKENHNKPKLKEYHSQVCRIKMAGGTL